MTEPVYADEAAFLADYDMRRFKVPLFSIDMVIFTIRDGRLQALLVYRELFPHRSQWSLPGGFVDVGNDINLEAAARRKLTEKTGLATPYLEQLSTVGNNTRDPRGWSVTTVYFALVNGEKVVTKGEGVRWVDVDDPLMDELAFDHSQLFAAALERLRNKVTYTALPVHLLPDEFTLAELKEVYEIVLQQPVDKSAFRRRFAQAGNIEPLEGKKRMASNRPAQLYRTVPGQAEFFFERSLISGK